MDRQLQVTVHTKGAPLSGAYVAPGAGVSKGWLFLGSMGFCV